jgi:hypothetical protein
MKRFLGIMFLFLFLSSNSLAGVTTGYKLGKGPLKVTKNIADIIEYFFSGGKNGVYAKKQKDPWKPGLMAISVDGAYQALIRHPLRVTQVDSKAYWGMVISDCKKKSGQECYLFANGYRIVWDNGSDKKKRRLKKKDIRAGKTIALLTELGFFDNKTSSSTSKPKENKKKDTNTKKKSESDKDIVKKLKELKELLDTGGLSKEEFEKAKKKLLN